MFKRVGDFLNFLRGREGYSVYVFFGESDKGSDFDLLEGPCLELSLSQFKRLKADLISFEKLIDDQAVAAAFSKISEKFLVEAAMRPGSFCGARIFRDGKTELSFIEDGRLSCDVEGRNASQAFFFLRDITHLHKHHAPTSDTILDVTSLDDGLDAWKRETLYSLYRWVIHRKRDQSLDELLNCKGVLAYARAFEETHCSKGDEEPEFYLSGRRKVPLLVRGVNLPTYNYQTTKDSVDASIERLREKLSKPSIASNFFSRSLPAFAVLVALLTPLYLNSPLPEASGQQALVTSLAEWSNRNILTTVGGFFLLSMIAGCSSQVKGFFRTSNLLHDGLRLAVSLTGNRNAVAIVILLLILSLLGLTVAAVTMVLDEATIEWIGPNRV